MDNGGWSGGRELMGVGCGYIARAGGVPAAVVLPGDLVTNCTASAVFAVTAVEPGGVAVLVAAGMTAGDSWRTGQYRVHLTHLQHAPQQEFSDLFAGLRTDPGGSR